MIKNVAIVLAVLIVVFIGYVATREGRFHYKASDVINAPAEKIFPYLTDFKRGGEWSPYQKMDPNMKTTFSGPENQVGSIMEFDSKEGGTGKLEILKIVPNELVQIRLIMIKPIHGDNIVEYKLTPEGSGTRFTWEMSGDGGFMGKLMNVFIDCDKMVTDQFKSGIQNLKTLIESQK